MDARNVTFMFYGFAAVWVILCAYVVSLVAREHRIKRQLESVKEMVEDREGASQPGRSATQTR